LTRETGGQDVVIWNVHPVFVCEIRDISERINSPVLLVYFGSIGIVFDSADAFSSSDAKYSMEAANAGKEVNKLESTRHAKSLAMGSHSEL
jgi:hypothetical protein